MAKHLWIYVLTLSAVAGCNETKTARDETHSDGRSTVKETTQVTHADREAYQKEMHQYLDKLNQETTRWREQLEKVGGQAKEEMQAQLKNLEKQRDVVAERLRELGRAGESAWGPMKEGLRKAFDDLKEAAHKAREKFR
jgi:hypothetical protein